jgi:ribose 5-phosphate isomerase B
MSPKRALFSLNVDSNAEHYHQHVTEHHPDGTSHVKVVESKTPTHGHTDLSYLTKPFEKVVNRAVDDVIADSGKKVHTVEGDVHYTSSKSSTSNSSSNLNIKNKSTRRFLERHYDVSEL